MMYPDLSSDELDVKYHSIQQYHIEFEKLHNYHVVCVYRNTFERLVSTFVDKVVQYPTSVKEKFVPFYPGKKTFHAFIQYMNNVAHLPETDVHFQRQYVSECVLPYIDEYIEIRQLNTIFNHDDALQEEFLECCTKMNFSTQRFDVVYNLSYYDFETDVNGLTHTSQVPSYRHFFNHSLIRDIEHIYADELRLFNITYPWKRDFTFISNSCSGWTLERKFKAEYNNPFIGSLIPNDEDYIELCEHFGEYMTLTPTIITEDEVDMSKEWHKQTGRRRWYLRDEECQPYIIMKLGTVEIHWIHELDETELLEKYERRRFRYRDSIPIFTWAEQQTFVSLDPAKRQELRERFHHLPSFTLLALRERETSLVSSREHRIECPYPDENLLSTKRNGNNNFTLPVHEGVDTTLYRMFESVQRYL